MAANDQPELDSGIPLQSRIGRALRAAPAVRRAVPLSDADKLILAFMDRLAQQIADESVGMTAAQAQAFTSQRVTAIVGSLDEVSELFAIETARYLNESVHRFRHGEEIE